MKNNSTEQLTQPGGAPHTFDSISNSGESVLEEIVLRSSTPDIASIAGWEFRGRNISALSRMLGIRKFIKGFVEPDDASGELTEIDGYNLWVRNAGSKSDTWPPLMLNGKPWRHGFFKVYPVNPDSEYNMLPKALLIDYSRGDNPVIHPSASMRDYLLQVYSDNPDLLIGKVYMPLGSIKIFGGYFVMERSNRP